MSGGGGDGGPSSGAIWDAGGGGGCVFAGIGKAIIYDTSIIFIKGKAPSIFLEGDGGSDSARSGSEAKIAICGVDEVGRGGGEGETVTERGIGFNVDSIFNRG